MRILFHFIASLILISPISLAAQQSDLPPFPQVSTGALKFTVDICQFEDQGDSTRLEIIYAVDLVRTDPVRSAQSNTTQLTIQMILSDQSDIVIRKLNEVRNVSLYDSLNPSTYTTFIDLITVRLKPGVVSMQLIIHDALSGRQGEVKGRFQIRDFGELFSLSDLYFVSHVQRATGTSVFEKHGVMLVPHPSRLFFVSDSSARMFIFYEINNLSSFPDKITYYNLRIHVSDMSGNVLHDKKKELLKVTGPNSSRVELIPLGKYDSGIYNLYVEAIDIYSDIKREISGYFQIIRKGSKKPDMLPMSEAEEKKYMDQIKYIASPSEIDIYNQLNPQGKQEFLLRFWRSRDPDPATPDNEFMIEHFRRMAIAEQMFKGGINSHMGRIYIQYGPPVDVERRTSSAGTSQIVEIWTYTVSGRTEFVFVDLRGDGEYSLVHSNHPDEYQNPDWEADLE